MLLQSFKDEFELPEKGAWTTPAAPGQVLHPATDEAERLHPESQSVYRSGVGKLLHLMRWSRPEICNAVRELSRYMTGATIAHYQLMLRVLKYCVSTPNRGKVLRPMRKGNDPKTFEFVISGKADSDFGKDPHQRRSVSGNATFLEGMPISTRSKMQGAVTLSVTEAEYVAATEEAQDMLFTMRLLESIGLKVKKPMILQIDNKGAVDLSNNWSAGGRTRHIDVKHYFLREMKEEGIIKLEWIPTDTNETDIFTKNCDGATFDRHTQAYCGKDEYNNT